VYIICSVITDQSQEGNCRIFIEGLLQKYLILRINAPSFLPLTFIQGNHCLHDIYVASLEPRITESVRQLGDLLLSIKGGGQVTLNQPSQRNAVAAEADEVLRPLMDLLDG
jgi:hypothetical protein